MCGPLDFASKSSSFSAQIGMSATVLVVSAADASRYFNSSFIRIQSLHKNSLYAKSISSYSVFGILEQNELFFESVWVV